MKILANTVSENASEYIFRIASNYIFKTASNYNFENVDYNDDDDDDNDDERFTLEDLSRAQKRSTLKDLRLQRKL